MVIKKSILIIATISALLLSFVTITNYAQEVEENGFMLVVGSQN